jgi:Na+/H+ antiporter NhaC
MKTLRLISATLAILVLLFLLFYQGDKNYLEEKSADKIWSEFLDNTGDFIKKGDVLLYRISPEENQNKDDKTYIRRFAYNAEILNLKNSPSIRASYILDTKFETTNTKYKYVQFTLSEKNTAMIIESIQIPLNPISVKSILPALIALMLCIITLKPILSVSVAVLIGSVINNSNSFIIGTEQIILKYIPVSLSENAYSNLKLIIILLLAHICMGILSFSGMTKIFGATGSSQKNKNPGLLYIIMSPLIAVHPYIFASIGSWWLNLFSSKIQETKRSLFWNQALSLVIPSILLSPYIFFILSWLSNLANSLNIPISQENILIGTMQYRFLSLSLISLMTFYFIFKRKIWEGLPIEKKEPSIIYETKNMVKRSSWLSYIPIIIIPVLSYSLIFFIKDINSVLLIVLFALSSTLIFLCYFKYLLNIRDILKIISKSLKQTFSYTVLILMSSLLAKILIDSGSAYYIIAIFKTSLNTIMLPLSVFIISTVLTLFIGNSITSMFILASIILPVTMQITAPEQALLTIAAIIEGGILGELLCPYSPSSIITASVGKTSSVKMVINQLPYSIIAFLSASILGFMMMATGAKSWLSYCIIILFTMLLMLKRSVK